MATITELALFKLCVENPQHIQKLQDLNLDSLSDPIDMKGMHEKEYYQKKALKLFHMAWSGVTKYMRTVTQAKCKPVEFPGLGIFMPVLSMRGESPQASKLTATALGKLNPEDMDVSFIVNQGFLNSSGCRVTESANENQMALISSYDPVSGEHQRISGLSHLNIAAVAKVCMTDIISIELVFKEIVAQLRHQLKKGCKIRISFKIGVLKSGNGELTWKSYRDDDPSGRQANEPSSKSQSKYSQQKVGSQFRKELSVMTPSVAKTRAFSHTTSDMKSFHMSNPNPQLFGNKFYGVRDVGYSKYEKQIDPTDVIKFGKKVNYESKMSNEQVMEEHLRQMREKMETNKLSHDLKRKQEKDFLNHIKKLDDLEKQRYNMGKQAINSDFVYYNGKIQTENNQNKNQAKNDKTGEKYNHFPFISGDVIEKHRASLGAQLKNDLQSYLDYQKDKVSVDGRQKVSTRKSEGMGPTAQMSYELNNLPSMNVTTNPQLKTGVNKSRAVKQLFDSEYVKPEDNFRVFQDNNPKKNAAMKEALSRYEDTLRNDNKASNGHLQEHHRKINFDNEELYREKEVKLNKQKKFNDQIQDQMFENHNARDFQKKIDKMPISTGFTPETQTGEAAMLFMKKREQQAFVNQHLTKQMSAKEQLNANSKQHRIQNENMEIEDNKKNLEMQREKHKQMRGMAKNHWEQELQRVGDLKKIRLQQENDPSRLQPLEGN